MRALNLDDSRSSTSRRRHHSGRTHRSRYEQDLANPSTELTRRHTHNDVAVRDPRPVVNRSNTDANIDMDLAYGECHVSALGPPAPPQESDEEKLNSLVDKAKMLLEEADCLQHSAAAAMDHLQQHPDAMAAVALTLAEISNLAAKVAPGVLSALKASAPSIWALLASPQFLIAAGVGVGVTVVMFGGYKIVKQLVTPKPKPAIENGSANDNNKTGNDNVEEMIELNPEYLNRVEGWRRGVVDPDAGPVDGEFITRTAATMSGLDISTEGMRKDPRFKHHFRDDESRASSHRSRRSRLSTTSHSKEKSKAAPEAGTKASSKADSKTGKELISGFKTPFKVSSKSESKAVSKAPEKEEKKSKDKSSDKDKNKSNDKDNKDKDKNKSNDKDKDKERNKDKDKDKDSEKDKDKDKDKSRSSKLRLMFTSS